MLFRRFNLPQLLALLSFLLISQWVQASLLISPTRVAFDQRGRSQQITLINTGAQVQTYRLDWIEQQATIEGTYAPLSPEQIPNFDTASNFIRVSPKQVRLAPGQRQTIKLLVRRPRGLPEGEYRSHLQFTALPPKDESADSGFSIKLNLLLSYNIPIMVRQGALDMQAQIGDVSVQRRLSDGSVDIRVQMLRSGKHSATGKMQAFWTPQGSNRAKEVGILNGVHFFHELSERIALLRWQDFNINGPGTLRIVYQGEKEFRNRILAEKSVYLSPSDITQIRPN